MTMKLLKNVKTALGGKRNRSHSPSANNQDSSSEGSTSSATTKPLRKRDEFLDCSTRTEDTTFMDASERDFSGLFEQAFFRNELMHLKQNTSIRRVTLQDFVQRYERDDLLALHDILGCSRQWKVIKFQDTVEGANYRRWLFKKENLRRALDQFRQDDRFPIVFEEHVKIDMDDMPGDKIAALLKDLKRDIHVRTLSFDGFLNYQDIDVVVDSLVKLLVSDERRWKKVVLRCSFDGEEFEEWNQKIQAGKKKLEATAGKQGTSIEFTIC